MQQFTPKWSSVPKKIASLVRSLGMSARQTALITLALATAAVFVGAAYLGKTNMVRDQYDAIAVWQNNSEGNWDIAYAIYRQSSDSWFAHPDKEQFYEGTANLIATVPGDDRDPDIASVKSRAIAVWSNEGGEGNKGADIYVARWTGVWEAPARLFALPGDDTDPTISMEAPSSAMAVWINRKGDTRALYYSRYRDGSWSTPEPIPMPGIPTRLAAPELGYLTLPFPHYLLTFEAVVDGSAGTYLAQYDRTRGWLVERASGAAPRVAEGVPARSRTASSLQTAARRAAVAWGGEDGKVWLGTASLADPTLKTKRVAEGENPVVFYGNSGTATIIYARGSALLSKTPAATGGELQVARGEKSPVRPDAAALLAPHSRSSVVVWRSSREGEGEIYFSSSDTKTGKWTPPRRIDVGGVVGDDSNPAVTPILVRLTGAGEVEVEDEYPYLEEHCGDSVLQKASGEECELGVPCKTGECDWDFLTRTMGPFWALLFADCECILPPDQVAPEPEQPKREEAKKEEVWYGGGACGFDGMAIVRRTDEEMTVKFTPPSQTGDTYRFAANGDGTWSVVSETGTMKAFPYAAAEAGQPDVIAILTPKGDTVTMRGLQPGIGLQLCIGTFTKGAPVERNKGFVPAPADEGLAPVPAL